VAQDMRIEKKSMNKLKQSQDVIHDNYKTFYRKEEYEQIKTIARCDSRQLQDILTNKNSKHILKFLIESMNLTPQIP